MALARGPKPNRQRNVYFIGAGVSSALNMPNTAALLRDLEAFFRTGTVWTKLGPQIEDAIKHFYPDAETGTGDYRPDVVDFFSALNTYATVSRNWKGIGLQNADALFRSLKRSIAQMLITRLKDLPANDIRDQRYLKKIVQPGNVIITTNWDTIVETHASMNGVPLRRAISRNQFGNDEVTLLKLHGSVDWCQGSARPAVYAGSAFDGDYAHLRQRDGGLAQSRVPLPDLTKPLSSRTEIIRVVPPKSSRLWQTVSARADQPWIATMATGKAEVLDPLTDIWRDAYNAIGYARHFEVAGYSLPVDDVEVRTLIRTGLLKGKHLDQITVVNPSPDVHQRFRSLVVRDVVSDYRPV